MRCYTQSLKKLGFIIDYNYIYNIENMTHDDKIRSDRIFKVVEYILRGIDVPGFDIDLISSGVVRSFRISRDYEKIIVFVDFSGSDPGCLFCKFINHTLWKSISTRIKESLARVGFKEVYVVDVQTGQEL
ncbi:MAG: hypothetical protein QXE13_06155 [Sulfolobales archaeon]